MRLIAHAQLPRLARAVHVNAFWVCFARRDGNQLDYALELKLIGYN